MKQLLIGSLVVVLITLGWGTHGLGEPHPAPQGELRVVDTHHANWIAIVLNLDFCSAPMC